MEEAAQNSVSLSITNPSARLSMLLGIVSVFGRVIITSIPAIVLGHMALRQIKDGKEKQRGKSMAKAGLILGYPVTILSLLGVLYIGYFFWWMHNSPSAGI